MFSSLCDLRSILRRYVTKVNINCSFITQNSSLNSSADQREYTIEPYFPSIHISIKSTAIRYKKARSLIYRILRAFIQQSILDLIQLS
ncbi:hypothetical protein VCRA2122O339_230031 [Vibrio crassostreae]|nr:hypothetical protein VCRA2120E331_10257 [Vibrio crassostreae]CAK3306015.1 hypothetical protein VCRA2127O345_10258 [Vibrio crassostreae]CAK3319283.1 hypothetical protein VCRA2120E330_10257 [Vibrio crassostreae]CAK3342727.1 hypothetical protein VCRA2122O338_10258 [Vibrio crassostreae]CAK3370800.1 hypothetical protein VCRA2122O339_230031 [Vibrio crassostreae]